MQQGQSSQATGTSNETYNLVSVLYHALQGAENCQTYIKDAQQGELRSFFEQALNQQRQLADQAKQILSRHLQSEGGSAFGFGQSQPSESPGVSRSEPSFSSQTGGPSGAGI